MKNHPYRDMTAAMVRTGILGFGGGPSVIPLIRHEAVNKYKWIDDDEFGEILAIANALPGPIATKMAAYLGFKLKGTLGAVVATLAHILPTCLAMVGLFAAVNVLSHSAIVAGMIGRRHAGNCGNAWNHGVRVWPKSAKRFRLGHRHPVFYHRFYRPANFTD